MKIEWTWSPSTGENAKDRSYWTFEVIPGLSLFAEVEGTVEDPEASREWIATILLNDEVIFESSTEGTATEAQAYLLEQAAAHLHRWAWEINPPNEGRKSPPPLNQLVVVPCPSGPQLMGLDWDGQIWERARTRWFRLE